MSEPIIELRNASIFQRENLVLSDVNLTLNKGEFRHQAFNEILPVRIASPWDIAYRRENFSVQGAPGAVAIYHKCPLADGAKALLQVENAPLLRELYPLPRPLPLSSRSSPSFPPFPCPFCPFVLNFLPHG